MDNKLYTAEIFNKEYPLDDAEQNLYSSLDLHETKADYETIKRQVEESLAKRGIDGEELDMLRDKFYDLSKTYETLYAKSMVGQDLNTVQSDLALIRDQRSRLIDKLEFAVAIADTFVGDKFYDVLMGLGDKLTEQRNKIKAHRKEYERASAMIDKAISRQQEAVESLEATFRDFKEGSLLSVDTLTRTQKQALSSLYPGKSLAEAVDAANAKKILDYTGQLRQVVEHPFVTTFKTMREAIKTQMACNRTLKAQIAELEGEYHTSFAKAMTQIINVVNGGAEWVGEKLADGAEALGNGVLNSATGVGRAVGSAAFNTAIYAWDVCTKVGDELVAAYNKAKDLAAKLPKGVKQIATAPYRAVIGLAGTVKRQVEELTDEAKAMRALHLTELESKYQKTEEHFKTFVDYHQTSANEFYAIAKAADKMGLDRDADRYTRLGDRQKAKAEHFTKKVNIYNDKATKAAESKARTTTNSQYLK